MALEKPIDNLKQTNSLDNEFFDKLREKIVPYYEGINPCHDITHTERVLKLSLSIAENENADLNILKSAVLLHDVARKEQDESNGKICHAIRGAEIARGILKELNFPEDKIEEVAHCIRSHRSKDETIPESIEAKILYDADNLDSIGAIGILRTASFSGHIGSLVHNPDVDIKTAKSYSKEDSAYLEFLVSGIHKSEENMMTKKGKEIAKERHEFMVEFFNRANKEVRGEL